MNQTNPITIIEAGLARCSASPCGAIGLRKRQARHLRRRRQPGRSSATAIRESITCPAVPITTRSRTATAFHSRLRPKRRRPGIGRRGIVRGNRKPMMSRQNRHGRNGQKAERLTRSAFAQKIVCGVICGVYRVADSTVVCKLLKRLVARDGIEPPTHGFSVGLPITESS
jgi:hypothetical protein